MTRYNRDIFLTVGRRCLDLEITDEEFRSRLLEIKNDVETDYKNFLREKSEKSRTWKTRGKRFNKNNRYNKKRSVPHKYEPRVAPALVNWRSYKENKGEHEYDFSKRLNSLLNKLSGDNYDRIQGKIFDMLESTKDLYCILEQLFSKAILQRSYCKYYARVAANLNDMESYKNIVQPAIVEYCQNLYRENSKLSNDVDEENYDELCSYFEYKNKFTGNFQFIGELYKHKLLDITMIEDFWNILLKDIRSGGEYVVNYSECLCKLLSTIGNALEVEYEDKDKFNKLYLEPVNEFSKDKDKFPPRIRFMYMDCYERKKWLK